ncbi:radical SAM protein (plasmid) [Clostridium perfringens]|uniref:radical SAM protein n=1 Tax=Clostridium perfringens TaxID=1502 RepID=UPI0030D3BD4E
MRKITKSLLWDITYKCNLNCSHCYNSEKIRSHDKEILVNNKNIKDILLKIKKLGINHIHFLGGEPFCVDNIFEIFEECSKNNILISINTNGTYLKPEIYNKLFRNNIINQITISIDGATANENDQIRGQGTYFKVLDNVKKMMKYIEENKLSTIVQIATVITKENIENIHRLPKILNQNGVKYLDILQLYECGNGEKNKNKLFIDEIEYLYMLRKILVQAYLNNIFVQIDCKPLVLDLLNKDIGFGVITESKFNSCQACESILFMDAYGDIFPCGPFSQIKKLKNDFSCNLFDINFIEKIMMYKNKMKNDILENEDIRNECNTCKYIKCCSGCNLCSTSSRLCKIAMNEFH